MKCKIIKAAMYTVEDYHNGVMEIDEYTKWCLKSAKNSYTEFSDSLYEDILECSLLFKKEDIDKVNKYYDPCENFELLDDCYDFDEESIRKSLRRFYYDENELTDLLMDENSFIIISDKDCYYHE